jgi:peptidoglycan/xylan/chitin deacetylase (PgdA/CDA1 family)
LSRVSRRAVRLIQPFISEDTRGVRILAYHLVGAGTKSVVDLPIETFRAQLEELRETAQVCSLADGVKRLEAGTNSRRPVAVVTFDDAFDNFRTQAWPLLREFRIPCTLYVPVGFVEGTSGTPLRGAEGLKPIEWSALRELAADPLITIGSHSWRHQDLRRLGVDELRSDLQYSRERLQEVVGVPIEDFCYPQAKRSQAVEREVQAVYRTAVVAGGRRNFAHRFNLLRLWRMPVRRDMPPELAPALRTAVLLEEWAASYVRALS